uniref:Uncharacterized protein n=1 Tax=Poecilia latipinna TaxID=48699 RepID=A0A3B3V059_9TELE
MNKLQHDNWQSLATLRLNAGKNDIRSCQAAGKAAHNYQHSPRRAWVICLAFVMVTKLMNGPYALITTAVSADLGTHESLRGNSRALSTVTAIIDGTGSIGMHCENHLMEKQISSSAINYVIKQKLLQLGNNILTKSQMRLR